MILVWVLLAAILIGYARGGKLSRYFDAPLKGCVLPMTAFMLEAAIPLWEQLFGAAENWLALEVLMQYALLFAFCCLNRDRKIAMMYIALASACNLAAMTANGFRMPVSPVIYENMAFIPFLADLCSGRLCEYVLVEFGAPLWFLGDTIPITVVSPGVASVGDFLLGAGVFVLIQDIMTKKRVQPQIVQKRNCG